MLESFRNLLSGKTLYVIVGICAIPFIFTGVSSFGTIFSNYGTVNGLEVSQVDVNSASGTIEQRYKSIFGESFSLDQLDEDELFELLNTQIVNQKMIESSAIENRLEMHDLHATMLHLLGVDHTRSTFRFSGRDMRLTDVHGHVVKEIVA